MVVSKNEIEEIKRIVFNCQKEVFVEFVLLLNSPYKIEFFSSFLAKCRFLGWKKGIGK